MILLEILGFRTLDLLNCRFPEIILLETLVFLSKLCWHQNNFARSPRALHFEFAQIVDLSKCKMRKPECSNKIMEHPENKFARNPSLSSKIILISKINLLEHSNFRTLNLLESAILANSKCENPNVSSKNIFDVKICLLERLGL